MFLVVLAESKLQKKLYPETTNKLYDAIIEHYKKNVPK